MQRASAAFGLLIFALWLAVLAVGLAYVTVWAATQRRPQWRILSLLQPAPATLPGPYERPPGASVISLAAARSRTGRALSGSEHAESSNVIPFDPEVAQRRRRV
jgi:hypothetical protein